MKKVFFVIFALLIMLACNSANQEAELEAEQDSMAVETSKTSDGLIKSLEKEFKPDEIQNFFKDDSAPNPGKKYDSQIVGESLCIFINLKKIGTIENIKKRVLQDIDNSFEEMKKIEEKKRPIKKVDYDLILQVGDLREEGLTYEQIAKIIFPRDFNIDNENAKPESAIRKAGQYYKRFQELAEFFKPHPRINKY